MNVLKENLQGITIGLRCRPNFKIHDFYGEIIDNILYKKKAFFTPEMFPKITTNDAGRILHNPDTKDQLIITNQDIILEYNVADQNNEFINKLMENFESDLIESVLKKYNVVGIARMGYVKKYFFEDESLVKHFLEQSIGTIIDDVENLNLSFSQKHTLDKGYIKAGVNDFFNVIYNIKKELAKTGLFISVDTQHVYDPFLDYIEELRFGEFIEKCEKYNDSDFKSWLIKNCGIQDGQK